VDVTGLAIGLTVALGVGILVLLIIIIVYARSRSKVNRLRQQLYGTPSKVERRGAKRTRVRLKDDIIEIMRQRRAAALDDTTGFVTITMTIILLVDAKRWTKITAIQITNSKLESKSNDYNREAIRLSI